MAWFTQAQKYITTTVIKTRPTTVISKTTTTTITTMMTTIGTQAFMSDSAILTECL